MFIKLLPALFFHVMLDSLLLKYLKYSLRKVVNYARLIVCLISKRIPKLPMFCDDNLKLNTYTFLSDDLAVSVCSVHPSDVHDV